LIQKICNFCRSDPIKETRKLLLAGE